MQLPELGFRMTRVEGEEIFLNSSNELRRVLNQRIPVFLLLKLPGLLTEVRISFPALNSARVYEGGLEVVGGFSRRRQDQLVAETIDPAFPVPRHIRSRQYGMEMLPWMPGPYLTREWEIYFNTNRQQVLNYSVLNCASGHTGVLIRVTRRVDRDAESLEIYHFSTGNDHLFAEKWLTHPHTILLARFVAQGDGRHITWKAQELAAAL